MIKRTRRIIAWTWIALAMIGTLIGVWAMFYIAGIMDGGSATMSFSKFSHICLIGGFSGIIALLTNRWCYPLAKKEIEHLTDKLFDEEEN